MHYKFLLLLILISSGSLFAHELDKLNEFLKPPSPLLEECIELSSGTYYEVAFDYELELSESIKFQRTFKKGQWDLGLLEPEKALAQTTKRGFRLEPHLNKDQNLDSIIIFNSKAQHILTIPKTEEGWVFPGHQAISYQFSEEDPRILEKVVTPKKEISYCYTYFEEEGSPYLSQKYENGRKVLDLSYDSERRVSRIVKPIDEKQSEEITLIYSETGVEANYSSGLKVRYHINSEGLVTSILMIGREGIHHLERHFDWSVSQDKPALLKAQYAVDESGHIFCYRTYDYDRDSRVSEVKTFGNFSGSGKEIEILENGILKNEEAECLTHQLIYDSKGRKVQEKLNTGEVKLHIFSGEQYLPSLSLTKLNDVIIKREFYQYDSLMNCTQHIIDDGTSSDKDNLTGVTQRKIIRQSFYTSGSSIGLIKEKKVLFLDLSCLNELLESVEQYRYDESRSLSSKRVLDANEKLYLETYFRYDSKGNCIEEIDPWGNTILREFNAENKCTCKVGPDPAIKRYMSYNLAGQLAVLKKESNLHTSITQSDYDSSRRLTHEIRSSGLQIQYQYDVLGRRISERHIGPSGVTLFEKQWRYDALSRVISEINERGGETLYSYNLHGEVSSKTSPNGSKEIHLYAIDGRKIRTIFCDKTSKEFSYDSRKRLEKITTYGPDRQLLEESRQEHIGEKVVRFIDPSLNTTQYSYDSYGRKIKEEFTDSLTSKIDCKEFFYDSLSRICSTKRWIDSSSFIEEIVEYNNQGQPLLELTQDSLSQVTKNITYDYDHLGRLSSKRTHNGSEIAKESYEYNEEGDLVLLTDPLGRVQKWEYEYSFISQDGARVTLISHFPGEGSKKVTEKDLYGRVKRQIRFSSKGKKVQDYSITYTPSGKISSLKEEVLQKERAEEEAFTTKLTYDEMDRLTLRTETMGSKSESLTRWEYDSKGRLILWTKPNEVSLRYSYDYLDRPVKVLSSDRTVHYTLGYDEGGRVTECIDQVDGSTALRFYNGKGDLLEETLANGVSLSYKYDSLSRPTAFYLPDRSKVTFNYEGSLMKAVVRANKSGKEQYRQTYLNFDDQGHCISSQLPSGIGQVEMQYDLLGLPSYSISPFIEEVIDEGGRDIHGHITSFQQKKQQKVQSFSFGFDTLGNPSYEKGATNGSYRYDSLGRRIGRDKNNYYLNEAGQISRYKRYSLKYDLNGNLIEQETPNGTCIYDYDALDRLTTVLLPTGDSINFSYDYFNRLVSRSSLYESYKAFLYLEDELIATLDHHKNLKELKVTAPSKQAIAIELDGQAYFPIYSLNGSISTLVKSGWVRASPKENYSFSLFGEELSSGELENPWRFKGQWHDQSSGLIFINGQFYLPYYGTYMSQSTRKEIHRDRECHFKF